MCGIAGIVALDRRPRSNSRALYQMAVSMKDRGPDDEGYLIATHERIPVKIFAGSDTPSCSEFISFYPQKSIETAQGETGSVFLAHRRLSIIDLSPAGHQPMSTSDGRFWIVFNGEIYNYRDIRKELEHEGIRFAGSSDTEVLLYAYKKWGGLALEKLNGMFAFAIWDNERKKLFCARDRIGIKPFYYTVSHNQFIFASDIKTIIASGLYKAQVDFEGFYYCMSYGITPRPLTAFNKVHALGQGHWLEIDANGQLSKSRYWRIPIGCQKQRMTRQQASESLEHELKRSIQYRLISDVPVSTFMSGGIDSTTVSAIASGLHPGIKAFTLSYENARQYDEERQARRTAAMHPMEHIVHKVDPTIVLDHLKDMLICYEEPFYGLSPNYVICKIISEYGIKVALNGLGGDELFGGYLYYRLIPIWRLLRRLMKIGFFPRLMHGLATKRHVFDIALNVASMQSPERYHAAVRSIFTDREKQQLFVGNVGAFDTIERVADLYIDDDIDFADAFEAVSYMDMISYIGNHHVYRVDKFSMRFSLEARVPFLDHHLVEAAFGMPSHLKFSYFQPKYILRQIAKKYIHPSCLKMKKKGFSFPTDYWMRCILNSAIKDRLQSLKTRSLFNPDAIDRIYGKWMQEKISYECVWFFVATEMWLEAFFD